MKKPLRTRVTFSLKFSRVFLEKIALNNPIFFQFPYNNPSID